MPRSSNRVGVIVDVEEPAKFATPEEPSPSKTDQNHADVSRKELGPSTMSKPTSETARSQRQKELLRKKKAERRAHAKQRAAAAALNDESVLVAPPAPDEISDERNIDAPSSTDAAANEASLVNAKHHKVNILNTPDAFTSDATKKPAPLSVEPSELARTEDNLDEETQNSLNEGEPCAVQSDEAVQEKQHKEKKKKCTDEKNAASRQIDNDVDERKIVSSANEACEAIPTSPNAPAIVLKKKNVKKRKSQRQKPTPQSPHAAATTIQKALKKRFLKRTLTKCKALLRHSSKIFAEEWVLPVTTTEAASPSRCSDTNTIDPYDLDGTIARTQDERSESSQQNLIKNSALLSNGHIVSTENFNSEKDDSSNHTLGSTTRYHKQLPSLVIQQAHDSLAEIPAEVHLDSVAHVENSPQTRQPTFSEHPSSSCSDSCSSGRSSRSSSSFSYSSSCSSSSECNECDYPNEDHRSNVRKLSLSKKWPQNKNYDKKDREEKRVEGESCNGPSAFLVPPIAIKTLPLTSDGGHQYDDVYTEMAVRIQAFVRGVHGRERARKKQFELDKEIQQEALEEVCNEACIRIQALTRGYLLRKRLNIGQSLKKDRPAKVQHAHKLKKDQRKSSEAKLYGHVESSTHINNRENGSKTFLAAHEKDRDSESDVAEWPKEFNLEELDDWDELNSQSTLNGDYVTHTHFLSKGKLRVFCGTWNLHAKKPRDDLRLWIALNKYHIVAIGSEECVNSIVKSVVFTSKRQWEDQLKDALGPEYVLVASHSLTAIHNIVFVHESLLPFLQNIQSDAVATGLGNQLGNKGGVGIAFSVGCTNFAFVNCHFDAHQHNVEKRNGNFHRINQELRLLPFPAQALARQSMSSSSNLNGLGKTTSSRFSVSGPSFSLPQNGISGKKMAISECFDRVFWYGDLNYRINGTRRMIDLLLLHNQFSVLRFNDQLQIEMEKGNIFPHFREGPLHFRPTYKFDKHSNVYDSSAKQRIPSWTDRILYLSNEKPSDIEILSYRSHMSFQTSDHRPVGASFQVAFSTREQMEAKEFSRILARGYKGNEAKSEVCTIQ